MKKVILLILLTTLLSVNSFAEKFTIPFSCYPKEIQKKFEERGMKLDLNGNDKTPESFGFIQNEGREFVIYTYKDLSDEDLERMRSAILDGLWDTIIEWERGH